MINDRNWLIGDDDYDYDGGYKDDHADEWRRWLVVVICRYVN